jgi:hypothetical protein
VRAESLAAARRGVAFLAREQRPAGDFATDWSDRLDLGAAGRPESPFLTGLILHALRRLPGRREVAAILERGTGYLLDVRPPGGLYVFLQGIAPDLDDVCLLHLVLQESHPRRFDYARLARRVAATATDAGPFPTWLEDEVRWADIDPVVNLNVVRFLHRNRTPCPRALDWLRGELAAWDFIDGTRYYESPFAPLYFRGDAAAGAPAVAAAGAGAPLVPPREPARPARRRSLGPRRRLPAGRAGRPRRPRPPGRRADRPAPRAPGARRRLAALGGPYAPNATGARRPCRRRWPCRR